MRNLSSPKRVLLTGASRGIGRETALHLAAAGHTVILAARSVAALEAVQREIATRGGRAEVLEVDVTDDASVEAAIARATASGDVDVLVNNAGACDQALFLDQPAERQRAEMELNYFGALRMARALLPSFVARGRGVIVNVSSLLGSIASPTTASYSATKAALEAWSFALRREVAGAGVTVSVFVSPHTQTEMGDATRFEGVRSLPVAYTARELVRAIDRAPRRYVASPVYRLLLRMAQLAPVFMESRVAASAEAALASPGRLSIAPRPRPS